MEHSTLDGTIPASATPLLHGKVALVTAASRGLGKASVEALIAAGARAAVSARASDDLAALAQAHGDTCLAIAGDLTDPAVPAMAVARTVERFGRLDLLVVNTPGPRPMQPMDARVPDFQSAFDTALFPAVRLIQCALPHLEGSGAGRIVIVSSTSVKAPKPFLCLSAAARSALWSWCKSAAPELRGRGINVTALFAGPHDTARARTLGVRDRPMGRPADFGALVAMLCSEASDFMTGSGLVLDGGELTGL